jgi:hypothetical protein
MHMYVYASEQQAQGQYMYFCASVYTYASVDICIYIRARMYVCTHDGIIRSVTSFCMPLRVYQCMNKGWSRCMHPSMHECVHVCVYVCTRACFV